MAPEDLARYQPRMPFLLIDEQRLADPTWNRSRSAPAEGPGEKVSGTHFCLFGTNRSDSPAPEDLLHLLSSCQFIDQLV